MNSASRAGFFRKSCLPPGWYPRDPKKIRSYLEKFSGPAASGGPAGIGAGTRVFAAAAPHAGWYYSGAIAAQAVSVLAARESGGPGTVAVIGGHLPGGMPPLFAMEDSVETPLGALDIDTDLRDALMAGIGGRSDRYEDNTVEVLLPMVKYFFPGAKLLWLRLPAEHASYDVGKTLARTAAALGRDMVALGSTDLTHYGPAYGFSPRGSGQKALDWVTGENDRRFIEAVLAGEPKAVLARAEEEKSACSAGAVLGVMGYAAAGGAEGLQGNTAGKCIAHGTSADVVMAEEGALPGSFVGYGAFVWEGLL